MNRNVSKINLNNIIFAEQMKGVDCVDGLDSAFLLMKGVL
jgi:hypothetical protein